MAQKIIFNQFLRPFASTFFFARVDFWPFWGAQQECSPKAKKPHRIMFFLKIEIFMFNLFYQTLEPRKKTPPSILKALLGHFLVQFFAQISKKVLIRGTAGTVNMCERKQFFVWKW